MNFLRTINSLPFPLTTKHYHVFDQRVARSALKGGKLDSPESWDVLRAQEPHFSIPETRAEWLVVSEGQIKKDGQDGKLIERGHDVAELLRQKGSTSLISVGAGGAGLEYQTKKALPSLAIVCSEYAPETVRRLSLVFLEAEDVVSFDAKSGDWSIITKRRDAETTACLMYRIDAQFTDKEWRTIFKTLYEQNVRSVLFIPTGFLTLKSFVQRLFRRLLWLLSGKQLVFTGYLRTETTFQSYWKNYYQSEKREFGGSVGFWLTRR